jgi:hypothetical protein
MLDTILLFEICYLIPERRLMRQGRLMSGGIGRLLGGSVSKARQRERQWASFFMRRFAKSTKGKLNFHLYPPRY